MKYRPTPRSRPVNCRGSILAAASLLAFLALTPERAFAGGGPENVVVVVNEDSWSSKSVANHFVHLRKIPATNIVYLRNIPDFEQVDIDTFRETILIPVLRAIEQRGIQRHVDYIVYSSDLPPAINAHNDVGDKPVSRVTSPIGAITGLTYLYEQVLAKNVDYLQLDSNRYMRRPLTGLAADRIAIEDVERFREAASLIKEERWAEAAATLKTLSDKYPRQAAIQYQLACCLARQEMKPEALAALTSAVDAGWTNRRHTENDADLKSLTELAEFRALLTRMDEKSQAPFETQPTLAFRASHQWNEAGDLVAEGGRRYLLSTMLAVASGRGLSTREAVGALRRSAAADASGPTGTIYYLVNGDVRSTTREKAFPSAVAALAKLNVKAEIVPGVLPSEKDDVAGAMIGTASFNWEASKSKILPGAICEHLTSYGGVMRQDAGQTPLTEFLRHGAAGASGTVTEPFAIQAKFPFAFLHVHYARGCSLAEAFYQSVHGPYQLLIVGDPLCQPWAKKMDVEVKGIAAGQVVSGVVRITPEANAIDEKKPAVKRFALFADGRQVDECEPGGQLVLDTTGFPDGHLEVRVVAVDSSPIEMQSRLALLVVIRNRDDRVTLTLTGALDVPWDQSVKIQAEALGASSIEIIHNSRSLATINAEAGEFQIAPLDLGQGPVMLFALAKFDGTLSRSAPLEFVVVPPPSLPAIQQDVADLSDGLNLKSSDIEKVIATTGEKSWLDSIGLEAGSPFTLSSFFEVNEDDTYQFQVRTNCALEILVDGRRLQKVPASGDEPLRWHFVPVPLAKGFHRLEVSGTTLDKSTCDIRFGGPGARSLDAPRFKHGKSVDN